MVRFFKLVGAEEYKYISLLITFTTFLLLSFCYKLEIYQKTKNLIIIYRYMAMCIEYHIHFHIIVNMFKSKCVRKSVYNGRCWLHTKINFVYVKL